MKKTEFHLSSPEQLPQLLQILQHAAAVGNYIVTVEKVKKQRTGQQNRALHQWFNITSEKMADAGITQRGLFDKMSGGFDLDTTPEMIKQIFRTVGKKMYNKKSTAELTTVEIQAVYLAVDRGFSQLFGITTPFPSEETIYYGGNNA